MPPIRWRHPIPCTDDRAAGRRRAGVVAQSSKRVGAEELEAIDESFDSGALRWRPFDRVTGPVGARPHQACAGFQIGGVRLDAEEAAELGEGVGRARREGLVVDVDQLGGVEHRPDLGHRLAALLVPGGALSERELVAAGLGHDVVERVAGDVHHPQRNLHRPPDPVEQIGATGDQERRRAGPLVPEHSQAFVACPGTGPAPRTGSPTSIRPIEPKVWSRRSSNEKSCERREVVPDEVHRVALVGDDHLAGAR